MSLNVYPTGASLAGNCQFHGTVVPTDGDALVSTGMDAGGILGVSIGTDLNDTNFIGIFNAKKFYGYGYASPEGRGIDPITNGRTLAKVRAGANKGDELITDSNYLVAPTGSYSADAHFVARCLETVSADGLAEVELYGLAK